MEDNNMVKEAQRSMVRMINTYGDDNMRNFIKLMASDHRTLQQSFTKLALMWLETVALEEYRVDDRNRGSQEIARRILRLFKEDLSKVEGYTGFSLDTAARPSAWLPII